MPCIARDSRNKSNSPNKSDGQNKKHGNSRKDTRIKAMANAQRYPPLHRLTAFCLIIPLSLAAHLTSQAKHLGLAQYSGLGRALFLIHGIGPLSQLKLLIRFAPLSQSPLTKKPRFQRSCRWQRATAGAQDATPTTTRTHLRANPQPRARPSPLGFTLVELCVALAILSIIASLLLPRLTTLLEETRATTLTNQLVGALRLGRFKALALGKPVSLCQLHLDRCVHPWTHSITLFIDEPPRGELSAPNQRLLDLTLTVPSSLIVWKSFGRRPFIRFLPSGRTANQNGTFYLCLPKTTKFRIRTVTINTAGRPRSGVGTSQYCQR